jgi:hypothetical protein
MQQAHGLFSEALSGLGNPAPAGDLHAFTLWRKKVHTFENAPEHFATRCHTHVEGECYGIVNHNVRREISLPDTLFARLLQDTPYGFNRKSLGYYAQANTIGQSATFRQDCGSTRHDTSSDMINTSYQRKYKISC